MKATDFIIEYLISKKVTNIFGYPGGVICHFMDSVTKYKGEISAHTTYHEQGAAFAACGYAQSGGNIGVAYATSGPGATNLITGIANAYADSLPVIFFTGQVDTFASKSTWNIRQRGFQEIDIVTITEPITKYCKYVESSENLPEYLEQAYVLATSGRPGPVLLDLPADVQRGEISDDIAIKYLTNNTSVMNTQNTQEFCKNILQLINQSSRPCFLLGAGVLLSGMEEKIKKIAEFLNIPVITSMNALTVLPFEHKLQFGFVGANGHRCANFILAKSDLIIALGSRLDLKQVGNKRNQFINTAKLIRVDIDQGELEYKVRDDEIQINADLKDLLPTMLDICAIEKDKKDFSQWIKICTEYKNNLYNHDYDIHHDLIMKISRAIPDNTVIVTDCGQNQVWTMQAFRIKINQKLYTTGSLGTMGYALPAAIGMHYQTKKAIIGFAGDGGFQMNIQELQFLSREKLPIKMIILNNNSLGMIRHFQEMNFSENYIQTTSESGYTVPNFKKIANAYNLDYVYIKKDTDLKQINWNDGFPTIIEIYVVDKTYLIPIFGSNDGFLDAQPLLPKELFQNLNNFN